MANYTWLCPFPGEWHFQVHVCNAIYKLHWGLLSCLVKVCHRDSFELDMPTAKWPMYDEFLKVVCQAMCEWGADLYAQSGHTNPLAFLDACKANTTVYETLWFLLPLLLLCGALRVIGWGSAKFLV